MAHTEAIIRSITPAERRDHTVINGSRRKRIAAGGGRSVGEGNRLLKQVTELRRGVPVNGGGGGEGNTGRRGQPASQAVHRDAAGVPDDRAGRLARNGSRDEIAED